LGTVIVEDRGMRVNDSPTDPTWIAHMVATINSMYLRMGDSWLVEVALAPSQYQSWNGGRSYPRTLADGTKVPDDISPAFGCSATLNPERDGNLYYASVNALAAFMNPNGARLSPDLAAGGTSYINQKKADPSHVNSWWPKCGKLDGGHPTVTIGGKTIDVNAQVGTQGHEYRDCYLGKR
jgi:hypothetical protein